MCVFVCAREINNACMAQLLTLEDSPLQSCVVRVLTIQSRERENEYFQ